MFTRVGIDPQPNEFIISHQVSPQDERVDLKKAARREPLGDPPKRQVGVFKTITLGDLQRYLPSASVCFEVIDLVVSDAK